jgi:hypothetical protein
MSLFDILPPIVYHILVIAGIIGILVSTLTDWLLPVSKYLLWIKVVIYGLMVVGLLGSGYNISENKWKLKYADLERSNNELALQNEKLKTEAEKKTVEVITRFITKEKIIEKKADEIINNVDQYISKEDDNTCNISDGFVRLFNDSVNATNSGVSNSTESTNDQAGTAEEATR